MIEPEIDLATLEASFEASLQAHEFGRCLHLHRELGSTQVEARRLAHAGAAHGTVVWALSQTAGRGRLDRAWRSPAGAGLWFSVILRPVAAPEALGFLSIVLGVGVARGLATHGVPVRLKWPNDLLLGGRKLGGLISEATTDRAGARVVVAGIGINLEAPSIAGVATAGVGDVVASPPAAALLAQVLLGVERAYGDWVAHGPEPTRLQWLELSDTVGREVAIEAAGRTESGRAVDLGADGSLVLESPSGERQAWSVGDVVHLRVGSDPKRLS